MRPTTVDVIVYAARKRHRTIMEAEADGDLPPGLTSSRVADVRRQLEELIQDLFDAGAMTEELAREFE